MSLVEPNKANYITPFGLPGSTKWRGVVIDFSSLKNSGQWPDKDNDKLDLEEISCLMVGGNVKSLKLTLDVRNFRAVKFEE